MRARSTADRLYNLGMRPRRTFEQVVWPGGNLSRLSVEMAGSRMTITARRFWEPNADLLEDGNFLILKAELAGVKIEDIQLSYVPDDHSISLRGVRPECDPEGSRREGIYQLEIFYGDFERTIPLPDVAIDPEGIEAALKDGLLVVFIPKIKA